MDIKQCLSAWKDFDDTRPAVPGEHWAVAGIGALLLLSALKSNSRLASTVAAMAGGALLFRAASGRDGVAQCLGENSDASEATQEQVELGRS